MFKVGDKAMTYENETVTVTKIDPSSTFPIRVQFEDGSEDGYQIEGLTLITPILVAKKDNVKDCKPPLKYIHPDFLEGIGFGMLAGEIKYDAWNFLLGHDVQDLLDGAVRHINLARKGEAVDTDTTKRLRDKFGDKAPEVLHIWLAACNLNMISWQMSRGTLRNSLPAPHTASDAR